MSRAFSEHERALLLRLVSGARDEEALRAQVEVSEYGEAWFEGSQSFTIVPGRSVTSPNRGRGRGPTPGPQALVLKDGAKPVSEENFVGAVLLWLDGDRITALEYWWVTDEMPDRLPRLEQLIDGS